MVSNYTLLFIDKVLCLNFLHARQSELSVITSLTNNLVNWVTPREAVLFFTGISFEVKLTFQLVELTFYRPSEIHSQRGINLGNVALILFPRGNAINFRASMPFAERM